MQATGKPIVVAINKVRPYKMFRPDLFIVLSCLVFVLSCLALPCLVLSLFCLVLSCLFLSFLVFSCLVLAWLGLAWLGLAWLGLAWLGLAWLGLAWVCSEYFLVWVGSDWFIWLGYIGSGWFTVHKRCAGVPAPRLFGFSIGFFSVCTVCVGYS